MPKSQAKVEPTKQETDMAKMLIDSMTQKFDIAAYHDEYQQKLREAISTKIAGKDIVETKAGTPSNIINLMDALEKSLDLAKRSTDKGTA